MSRRQIMPAVSSYAAELVRRAELKSFCEYECGYEKENAKRLSELLKVMMVKTDELESTAVRIKDVADVKAHSYAIRDELIPVMNELRAAADEAETLTAEESWPFPTYEKLLFSVN
jgi:glutamine synthetase